MAKGPGRMTSGDCISAFRVRQLPPLSEALGSFLISSRFWEYGYQDRTRGVMHVTAWGKWPEP